MYRRPNKRALSPLPLADAAACGACACAFAFACALSAVAAPEGASGQGASGQGGATRKPRSGIAITYSPNDRPDDTLATAPVRGTVRNAPAGSRVVVWARGSKWHVQPFEDNPGTEIAFANGRSGAGTWECETHGGLEHAAYLVTSSYEPPAGPLKELPEVGGKVLAMARAKPTREDR